MHMHIKPRPYGMDRDSRGQVLDEHPPYLQSRKVVRIYLLLSERRIWRKSSAALRRSA